MSIKILTKNGIDNTNIDGARDCNFNAGNRSGIVKSVLNEGRLFSVSSNTIGLDTCELRIFGHRIVIDEIQYKTFTSIPSSPVRYALVAQVSVTETVPTFALNVQSVDTVLHTDNINNGNGIYEIELGRFTHNTDGSVTDIVRTIDIITGGISGGNSEYISIGAVTTNTLDSNLSAEVDIENRKTPEGKMVTDFSFSIPRGLQGEKGATGAKIVSTELQGQDANGGNIYKQTFDDGSTAMFTAPKGAKGDAGSDGSEYANTSEIVDISLTTSDDITSLANKILANKTKVSKISAYDSNVVRILGSNPYPNYPTNYINLYFTVLAYNRTILVTCVPSNVDGPSASAKTTYINNLYAPDGNYYWYSCHWDEVGSAYPVGSIYINAEGVPGSYNPAGLFGGTWQQINDVFLLAAGTTYPPGSTGGEATHTLTVSEMPAHSHELTGLRIDWSPVTSEYVVQYKNDGTKGRAMGTTITGESMSHNNMPPYLTVYMWKRIA